MPNLSVLDGWRIEGCIEDVTGRAVGDSGGGDTGALYQRLEHEVLPLYYRDSKGVDRHHEGGHQQERLYLQQSSNDAPLCHRGLYPLTVPEMDKVTIEIFADVLCVWAYIAQVRCDQLRRDFGGQIELRYRYIPIFGATERRIQEDWRDRGGAAGFNRHLHEVAGAWKHIKLHPRVWLDDAPASCVPAHLYLKACQLLEQNGEIPDRPRPEYEGRTLCEEYSWRVRCAFFAQAHNIARVPVLEGIAQGMQLPLGPLHDVLTDGQAHAALQLDSEARDRYLAPGSPTLVFNEGRQRLYGNVGYRIIKANIRELLKNPQHGEASWC